MVPNFGDNPSVLSIQYGLRSDLLSLPLGPSVLPCTNVGLPSANRVSCRTAPGSGGNYVFQLIALNSPSQPGFDTYFYPIPPSISNVTGCPINAGSATRNCPTTGGTLITIDGANFAAEDLSIKIGAQNCLTLTFISNSCLTCVIPAGCGF